MRSLALGVVVLLAVLTQPVQGQYSQQWSRPLAGSGSQSDQGTDIAADKDGYSYVAGQYFSTSTKSLYRIRRYKNDATGMPDWTADYGPTTPSSALHVPHHIATDGTNLTAPSFVYVTGESPGTNGLEIATLKLNASTGALVWATPPRYANADYAAGNDVGRFVAANPDDDNCVYVCGYSEGKASGKDFVLLKYDSSGNPSSDWPYISASEPQGVRRYHNVGDDDAAMLVFGHSSPGNDALPTEWVCVAGTSVGSSTNTDIALVMYNADDGTLAWAAPARFDYFSGSDSAVALFKGTVVNADDTLLVAGTSQHNFAGDVPLSYDFVVVARDLVTGAPVTGWGTSTSGYSLYDSSYNDVCYAADTGDGSTITLVGGSGSGSQSENYRWVRWYQADGSFRWVTPAWQRDGGVSLNDRALDVTVDGKGRGYITGRAYRAVGQWDYMTLRIDPSSGDLLPSGPGGTLEWPIWYSGTGGGNDTANAIAIDPRHVAHNDAWITGGAVQTTTGLDWRTNKYHHP